MGHATYDNNDDMFLHWSRGGRVYQVKCLYDDPRLNPSGYELIALDNKDPQAEITIKGAIGRIHSSYEWDFNVTLSDCRATLRCTRRCIALPKHYTTRGDLMEVRVQRVQG